jgi:hypothetical protein
MKKRITHYALLFTILLITAARADINAVLDNGIGARSAAMGFAQVATPKGADSIYWNPAALAKNDSIKLSSYSSDVYGTNYKTLSGAFPGWGGDWGLLAMIADQGAIMETGLDSNGRPAATGSLFSYGAAAYYLSYARDIGKCSIGTNLKYFAENLKDNNANGFGLDVGLQAKPAPMLTVGGKLENILATPMRWNTASGSSDKIAPALRLGASVNLLKDKLSLDSDLNIKEGQTAELFLGGEYDFYELLFLRGGFFSNRPSIGVGLFYKGLTIDYSYVKGTDFLEDSQRISLSFAFGPANVELPYPPTASQTKKSTNYSYIHIKKFAPIHLSLLKSPPPKHLLSLAQLP